jgi:putative redox protein
MDLRAVVSWKDGMAFDVEMDGHHVTIDAKEEHGGRGLGPRPKPLLLASLAGCAAMDVASILGKMRVPFRRLVVEADGHTGDDHPKKFERAVLRYVIEGDDLPLNKVRRALNLSEDKYCGVWATLEPTVELTSALVVNGEEVPRRED